MSLFDKLKNEYNDIYIEFVDYNEKKLYQKIKDINEQFILTNSYYFDKIVGCLHNYGAEISGNKVKDTKGVIAVFTGWNESVSSN